MLETNFVYGSTMDQLELAQREFLDAVELRIASALAQHDEAHPNSAFLLNSVGRHLCVTPNAKRIRPLLTFWYGVALGIDTTKLVSAAVACELIHSASLLHDDVVDDAATRRGSLSANAKWNNSVAVLSGNYLLAVAFDLLGQYPSQITRDGIMVVKEMTKAAITEIEVRSRVDTSEETWREVAIGKTGALFGMCALVAARLVGHEDAAAAKAVRLGKHIGLVFQMNDDIIDITSSAGLKDRYSDILNKEPSLPIIIASRNVEFRNKLTSAWLEAEVSAENASSLGALIANYGALEATHKCMQKEIEAAIDTLGNLAYTPGGKKITEWLNLTK